MFEIIRTWYYKIQIKYLEYRKQKKIDDIFRPVLQPAKTIYDAFQTESKNRQGRSFDEWTQAERNSVWKSAHNNAQKFGLRPPTMADVRKAEISALGHSDYGAKWAYGVVKTMNQAT